MCGQWRTGLGYHHQWVVVESYVLYTHSLRRFGVGLTDVGLNVVEFTVEFVAWRVGLKGRMDLVMMLL